MIRRIGIWTALWVLWAGPVLAHASRQSFVLLLPTGFYIAGGIAAVALTVIVISALPAGFAKRLFRPLTLARSRRWRGDLISSTLAFAMFAAALGIGLAGSSDPTRNLMPLMIWFILWLIITLAHGMVGNLWRRVNPWTGPLAILRYLGVRPVARPPFGHWPALVSLVAFGLLLLVHPRANDPVTLVQLSALYWGLHFLLGLIFGPRWLSRGEALTVMFGAYTGLSALGSERGRFGLGLFGWRLIARPAPSTALACFMIALLAIGSFDGLYRTFFWFSLTDQNPLEFMGRTTVIWSSTIGLLLTLPLLTGVYLMCLWLGTVLIKAKHQTGRAFRAFAPALLPIAFAYHFAHYLPAIMIEAQALPIILNDPLGTRADLFGWAGREVTTGFLNRLDTVNRIWLAQAGMVVAGHMIAILISHRIALSLFGTHRRAALSQVPIAVFMVAYTLFGLWLLASPQGS